MKELNQNDYRTVLRQDFSSFVHRCFNQLNPQARFYPNWHLEVIAAKLEACRLGQVRRLIINVPPRHLKSLMGSVAFPAWCLGQSGGAAFVC